MDTCKVIISPHARSQLVSYHDYLQKILLNEQAAKNMWEDALLTIDRLSFLAGSLRACRTPVLRDLGYHIIRFKSHRYLMIYRTDGNTAYVEAVYHELQDYEALFSDHLSDPSSV